MSKRRISHSPPEGGLANWQRNHPSLPGLLSLPADDENGNDVVLHSHGTARCDGGEMEMSTASLCCFNAEKPHVFPCKTAATTACAEADPYR
jgi:hypothetical protein